MSLDKIDHATFNGRHVDRGTALTVVGAGRVRFLAQVTNTATGEQWIDAVDRRGHLRSFRLSAVKTVHRK